MIKKYISFLIIIFFSIVFTILISFLSEIKVAAINNNDNKIIVVLKSDLLSEVGINFTNLRNLLRDGKWQEADIETGEIMRKITNQQTVLVDNNAINNFPCKDLRTIDRLWLEYSNNHFGFSIQKKIWLELGGKIDDETNIKLSERLGWFKKGKWIDYPQLIFNIKAPAGHLPFSGMIIWSEHGEYIDDHYVATAQGWASWPPVLIMQRVLKCK